MGGDDGRCRLRERKQSCGGTGLDVQGVMAAAKNRTEIPNIKDIFQGMADASRECDEMLEIYYGDEDPLPPDVRRAIQRVQDGLSNCANAFVAYMAIARLTLG